MSERKYAPQPGQIDTFNTLVRGQAAQRQDHASGGTHYDPAHYYDQPVELRRTNRYGFEVVTYHHSQGSYDYTAAEVI